MMNSEEFVKLLSAKHYTREDLQSVSDVCRSYPMFNAAHMLKVRILEKLKLEKENDLRIAAVYAVDRKKLFEFVDPGSEMPVMEQGEEDTRVSGVTELHFLDEEHENAELVIHSDNDYQEATDKELLEIDPEQEQQEEQKEEQEKEQKEEENQQNEEDNEEDNEVEGEDEEDNEGSVVQIVEKQEADMEDPADQDEQVFPTIDLIDASEDPGIDEEKEKETEKNGFKLIERFIKQEPGPIKADKQVSLKGDASVNSVKENDQLITDTLAKIYVKQGLHAKAIYAYEKLSLKFPEKSAYFAAQIDKIKNGTNS